VESGDEVAILLRPESDAWRIEDIQDRVEVIAGRLSEPDGIAGPLGKFKPDVIYHLGWFGSGRAHRDDPRQLTENVANSVALVELAADAGATTWIGLGSQAEYGPTASVIDESTPTSPTTTDEPSYLIPQLILSLLRGRRPSMTEGSQPGDFLHVTDACRAIRAAALAESCIGTYVLASGQHRPVREVALTIRHMIDPRLEIGLGELVASVSPVGLRGDPRALQRVTGWSPAVPLGAGLAECVEWYRRNLNRYSRDAVN
jgi:UDP-glucose 4-epimerase